MGLRPGQANEYYKQGGLDGYNFKNNPELRKKATERSIEVRKAKKKKADTMRENLEILMSLNVKDPKYKRTMENLGIEEDEQTNKMLVMVSLFRRAIKGDVSAIRQITDMMDQYGILGDRDQDAGISINIVPYRPKEPIIESDPNKCTSDAESPFSVDCGELYDYMENEENDPWKEVE